MKTCLCLLLCSAVALWASVVFAAPRRPHTTPRSVLDPNLKEIFEIIEGELKLNYTKEEFVASARELTEGTGRCGGQFFCAVRKTLHNHRNATKGHEHEKIVRNLDNFNSRKHGNCTAAPMNARNTTGQLTLNEFFTHIQKCIRCRNLATVPNSPSC